ncbi:hypothetical protein KJ865_08055, partial [Myxococcota bacterium]|nr:hypothetical protein [Myxococcota bacterium]
KALVEPLSVLCSMGEPESCTNLSRMAREGSSDPIVKGKADHFAQLACFSGSKKHCLRQAKKYARGKKVPSNPTLAAKLYQKACELGHGKTCYSLGTIAMKAKPPKKDEALKWFGAACAAHSKAGCRAVKRLEKAADSSKGKSPANKGGRKKKHKKK